jgi:hypothetical protein
VIETTLRRTIGAPEAKEEFGTDRKELTTANQIGTALGVVRARTPSEAFLKARVAFLLDALGLT